MNILKDKNMRMVLLILFAALFVVSAAILIAQAVQKHQDDEANRLAEYYATMTDDTTNEPPASTGPSTSEPAVGSDNGTTDSSSDPGTVPGSDSNVPTDTQTAGTSAPADDTTNKSDETTKAPSSGSDASPSQGNNKDPGNVNVEALQKVNKDVCGWIYINGPSVNYPLIHYKDNSYYLRRNWLGQKSNPGCIMVEATNNPDFSEFNTIIYGHNIRANTFFGQIDKYMGGEAGKWDISKGYEFWKKYHEIRIYTEKEILTYNIYAVYITSVDSTTFLVGMTNKNTKQNYINYGISNSVYDTGIVPTVDDRVITLSTCDNTGSYDNRLVVQAVLTNSEPR